MTQSHGHRRPGTPVQLLAIAAALFIAGCAPSPLYTGHVKRFAPGGVPRDQFGQPLFERPRSASQGFLGIGRRTAVPAPAPPRPAGPAIIYYPDLRYSDRTPDPAAAAPPR